MFIRLLAALGGRKFILAVFSVVAVALQAWLGISAEAVMTFGGIVAAYLLGQGFADGFSGGATSTTAHGKEQAGQEQ